MSSHLAPRHLPFGPDVKDWQVDFATDILDLLNPLTRGNHPPDGWHCAIGGRDDVALTEQPPRAVGAARTAFVVTIRVTSRGRL